MPNDLPEDITCYKIQAIYEFENQTVNYETRVLPQADSETAVLDKESTYDDTEILG